MALPHGSMSSEAISRTGQASTRSIGEVLAILKTEFDDITISKIRFLESEGLVTPQRTPSGYRKFSGADVERLRYILRQQKENFLPLKVIRERLDEATEATREATAAGVAEDSRPDAVITELPKRPLVTSMPTGPLSRRQLIEASGLSEAQLRSLEGFKFVQSERTATGQQYDGQALGIARLAARFMALGVEARHLRIFRTAAEREADLYKQLVVPNQASRSAQVQTENRARMEELTSLGAALHDELLREQLDRFS